MSMVLCFKGLPLFLALSDAPLDAGGISGGLFLSVTLPGPASRTCQLLSLLVATKDLPTAYWLPCPRIRWFLTSR